MPESAFHGIVLNNVGQAATLDVRGYGGAAIQLSGTWVATVDFEATADGATWVAINAVRSNGSTAVTGATSNGAFVLSVAGFQSVRAKVSAWTSGAVVVGLRADLAGPSGGSSGGGSGGGTSSSFNDTFPSTGTAVGAKNAATGNMEPLALDTSGNLKVVVSGAGSAVSIADGADVTQGALADAAVTGDNSGTVNAHLRGLTKILADVWDSVSHYLKVNIQNATLAVTQSGTWTVQPGNTPNTTAWKVDGSAVTQPVSGTVTANAGTNLNTSALALEAGGNLAAQTAVLGATTGAAVITDANGTIQQYLRGLIKLAITAGGFIVRVGGGAATNVAVADNPLNQGAQAVSSENAAVTTGRMVQLVADLVGKLIVLPYANPENFVNGAITTPMTATTSTSLVAAPGAGLRNYITTLVISNAHATVSTDVVIQDGSGGTTLLTIPAAAVYGGAVINLPVPLRQPTTNTALYCANVTNGASVKASAVGYKGA